jgi:hypothetical protein
LELRPVIGWQVDRSSNIFAFTRLTAASEIEFMNQWSLRTEILSITHRWPVIVLFILVGSLIGMGVAQIWPSPYQATVELYVGLDPYRWAKDQNVIRFTGGVAFNYPDDYKNWQMANLNVIILTDDVKREVLRRLRERDSYWSDVNRGQLSEMMDVYWRNVGKWRLVINNPQSQYAVEAVDTWQQVAIELIQTSIYHARNTMLLDIQLQSIATQQTQIETKLAAQQETLQQLQQWQSQLSQIPAGQTVSDDQRSQLQAVVAVEAGGTPGWTHLLNNFPPSGSSPAAFQKWITDALALVEEEILQSQHNLTRLEAEWNQTQESYIQASQGSRGVSPTLQVEKLTETIPPPVRIRPTSTLALIGGLLGLVIWALFWSGWLAIKARK